MSQERRAYPRVQALVFFRPISSDQRRPLRDISQGGIGVFSDEPLDLGDALEVNLYFPDHTEIRAVATVARVRELPPDSESKYDIGLAFTDLSDVAQKHIDQFIKTVRAS